MWSFVPFLPKLVDFVIAAGSLCSLLGTYERLSVDHLSGTLRYSTSWRSLASCTYGIFLSFSACLQRRSPQDGREKWTLWD
ncbi:hypothetical protein F4809DRAFT_319034 [Biscogniauxia mediterranea]|nr:hypothetical protein F4809DRAFT_319034 [Biscogniauxia mediterranea]